jgi:small subunit ribosomal protein S20
MPNKASAKKALRQSDRRTERNKIVKAEIKSLRIKLRKAIDATNVSTAEEVAKTLGKKLDKAVAKNVYKQNTAARYKARFMKKINALKKA